MNPYADPINAYVAANGNPDTVGLHQIAEAFGVSPRTVYRYIYRDGLPAVVPKRPARTPPFWIPVPALIAWAGVADPLRIVPPRRPDGPINPAYAPRPRKYSTKRIGTP